MKNNIQNKKHDRAVWFVLAYACLICCVGVAIAQMVTPRSHHPIDRFFNYQYNAGRVKQLCPCEDGVHKDVCCGQPIDISDTQVPMLKTSAYACFYAKFGEKEVVLCQPQPKDASRNATITLACVKACDIRELKSGTCKRIGLLPDKTPCYWIEKK
ncbi:MAG: hypothetical protein UU47_C0014G0004 [candidate division TM6 bacterium GW2011_GWE2_41_16]|nr:MAG: hypothetical protein UU47_C0014G0004 [candidate division TM6 bacterium GW2011_GWE2_41_16]